MLKFADKDHGPAMFFGSERTPRIGADACRDSLLDLPYRPVKPMSDDEVLEMCRELNCEELQLLVGQRGPRTGLDEWLGKP